MIVKNFSFVKSQKVPSQMEETLNEFLEKNAFKWATHCESPHNNRVSISIFAEPIVVKEGVPPGVAKVRAKVFRASDFDGLEEAINEFLAGPIKLKFATQSFIGNNITAVVFHE